MMADILNPAPTYEQLANAPSLNRWRVVGYGREDHMLTGVVHDHARLGDGKVIYTSKLVRMDMADEPQWAETQNNYYALLSRMGPCESRIWDLIEKHHVVVIKPGHPSYIEQMRELFGPKITRVGQFESTLLVMLGRRIVTKEQAHDFYLSYCHEVSLDPFAGGEDDA
ncbi:hypothetical protein ELG63_36370 [Rhizobium leguminosarum]|uniref:DUF6634 family protein n=1 Tax=Rhizobium leguminosarum TaxID=384 RepID=UPI00103266ED|nr:DUF6634 family protein [Rhizobium leguminosarum]TBH28165.1 hypothetical protein ELG63_36370 [Rhizobium leguminosarum]